MRQDDKELLAAIKSMHEQNPMLGHDVDDLRAVRSCGSDARAIAMTTR